MTNTSDYKIVCQETRMLCQYIDKVGRCQRIPPRGMRAGY